MKQFIFLTICLFTLGAINAQNKKANMQHLIQENFDFAKKQYLVLRDHTPADRMPQYFNANTNKWVTSDTKWWCSGFYPGSLLYIYEYTKDSAILSEAKQRLAILEKEKHYTGNHDLGFMMFCSFGNAYRILGNPEYKTTVDTAAASLSTRYRPSIKAIQSWNKIKKFECPLIIDNMMNLELLSWVSDHGGDPKYKQIAITHANTTIKNHFKPDYSSYHVIDYNLETGGVLKKKTWQGYSDASAWARGQSWGFYGYTMMYRFTKNKTYLKQAEKIADFILNHPNMPKDGIPYWDFNAPNIPNELRDASAASVLASGLLELGQYVSKSKRKKFVDFAEKILQSLSSDTYRAALGENGGFLLKHSVGAIPFKSEIDVPLTYADYYYLEALLRYKNWYL